jgi:hypothetical protein
MEWKVGETELKLTHLRWLCAVAGAACIHTLRYLHCDQRRDRSFHIHAMPCLPWLEYKGGLRECRGKVGMEWKVRETELKLTHLRWLCAVAGAACELAGSTVKQDRIPAADPWHFAA